MKDKKQTQKPIILGKRLYGKVRLEHHPGKGFYITFWVTKFPFWISFWKFEEIYKHFKEIKNARKDIDKK